MGRGAWGKQELRFPEASLVKGEICHSRDFEEIGLFKSLLFVVDLTPQCLLKTFSGGKGD